MKSKDWWSTIVKNVLIDDSKSKNLKLDESLINQISDDIFNEFSKEKYWKKYENCDSILNELNKRNFKLGVISNFDERLFVIMKNLKIDSYFSFVCIPSNTNSYKPQHEIFKIARDQARADNDSFIIHIGDDFDLDYKASLNSNYNFKSILLLNEDHNKNKYNQLINNNNHNNSTNNNKQKKELVQIDKNDIAFNLEQLLELILIKY